MILDPKTLGKRIRSERMKIGLTQEEFAEKLKREGYVWEGWHGPDGLESWLGTLFFVLVLFAALTSSISLAETVVSTIQDKLKIDRRLICLIVLAGALLLGLPSALGYGLLGGVKIIGMQFLDFFDFITNSILMPITAICTSIFVGYILKPKAIIDEIEVSAPFKSKKLFTVVIKYIAPVCLVMILVSSVLDVFGVVKI